jgi:hypothetical protein
LTDLPLLRTTAARAAIRNGAARDIPAAFDAHLVRELTERRGQQVKESFSYALFRPMSIDRINTRFARYFLARVEQLVAGGMAQKMRHGLRDLVTLRGSKNGFHIEHILSRNETNLALFGGNEEMFEQERNRLGGVLLLKGKDNISSNNEVYPEKLKTYANTLFWNETLRADTYKSKLDFRGFIAKRGVDFKALERFGPEELESRQRLLFDLCCLIWPPPNQVAQ